MFYFTIEKYKGMDMVLPPRYLVVCPNMFSVFMHKIHLFYILVIIDLNKLIKVFYQTELLDINAAVYPI